MGDDSRRMLARAIAAAIQRASLTLARLAKGEVPESTFFSSGGVTASSNSASQTPVPFDDLVKGWAFERRPVAKTVYEWTRVLRQLEEYQLDILSFDDLSVRIHPKKIETLVGSLLFLSKESRDLATQVQDKGKPRELPEERWIFELADIYKNAFGQTASVSGSGSESDEGEPTNRRGKFYRLLEVIYLGALREGLRDFGYAEGKNISLEMRFPAEQYERFFILAAELVQLKPDVLVSAAGTAAIACHRATTTIPLVFVNVPDPVGRRLVASLSRPGGHATGLSNMAVDLTKKRIELAKEMIAGLSRVAMLVNASDEVGSRAFIADGEAAARELSLTVVPVGVRGANELEAAISKISEEQFQAMVVTVDGLFFTERKRIADLALARRLPTIVYSKEPLEAGGLISYGPSAPLLYRRAAYFVDKILKGARPGDLPVEQPTKFELLINLKTAKTLGLTMPPTLLARADEVIE